MSEKNIDILSLIDWVREQSQAGSSCADPLNARDMAAIKKCFFINALSHLKKTIFYAVQRWGLLVEYIYVYCLYELMIFHSIKVIISNITH